MPQNGRPHSDRSESYRAGAKLSFGNRHLLGLVIVLVRYLIKSRGRRELVEGIVPIDAGVTDRTARPTGS